MFYQLKQTYNNQITKNDLKRFTILLDIAIIIEIAQ